MNRGGRASWTLGQLVRSRDKTRENGLTLIEILVTVVIMGLAFVVILGGMTTAILGSDVHRRQVTADALLRTIATDVKSAVYDDCAGEDAYNTLVDEALDASGVTDYTASATIIGWWDGDTFEQTPCASPVNDKGLQLIRIEASSVQRNVKDEFNIVKRDSRP